VTTTSTTNAEQDPRVASAISHWAPRFVTNGVPLTDFEQVTGGLRSWDDWCRAWSARAAVHEAMGRDALAAGHRISAGEHLTRAAVCYHFGKFLFVDDLDQMREAARRAVACRTDALPLLDPPGERVAIPYEGTELYGNLRRPLGVERPPVVAMCMGLDSTKEEMHDYEQRFLRRGLATFAFDGPGQGEAEHDLALVPEYERPVAAVFDVLERRDDLDPDRIGLWGVSLGGYFAARAACFERRAKACVSLSGAYERSTNFHGRPAINIAAFIYRSKSNDIDEAAEISARMSLRGVASGITCPIYIVAGTADRITPSSQAELLAAEVSGPVVLDIVEGGNHVVNNLWYRYRDQTADWMAEQLGVRQEG
jgi:dienelactone hydrolase